MRSLVLALALAATAAAAAPCPEGSRAGGPPCPAGTVELSRDEVAKVLDCLCIAELTLAKIKTLSPENVARLSPGDRRALRHRQAVLEMDGPKDALRAALDELAPASDAEVDALLRRLEAEQRSPLLFSLIAAAGAALGAVGGMMLFAGAVSRPLEAALPGVRRGMALGAVLGLGVTAGGYAVVQGGLPIIQSLSTKAVIESVPAIGFAPGTARTALENVDRLKHASDKLIKAGLFQNWNNTTTKDAFVRLAEQVLEHPTTAFNHKLFGTAARGFAGKLNGQHVVIFVFKEGPYSVQIASAWVPSAEQALRWGLK